MEDLIWHAKGAGLGVNFRDLGRRHGELRSGGVVIINDRRPVRQQRITLAHELGHWAHRHDWRAEHDVERDEREADTYAALLLIAPLDYAIAERIVGSHPAHLARELGVTVHLIQVWQRHHDRRGRTLRMDDAC